MAEGSKITPQDLELASPYEKYAGRGLREAREELEKDFIERALRKSKGNMTKTAEELGISRPTLYELIGKLGLGKS